MTKPYIPYRWTRLRAGESTFTDMPDSLLQEILAEMKGYEFDLQPWDGGVWLHCHKSPNRVITIGEKK